ncbi:hypothetical protein ADU20_06735 [Burkholderia pseudomallei]|nr:hypothetical protein T210_0115375 [Burkholderia pseudomallei MSHR6137]KNA34985.1 hypothetical protein ADU20_06735 [Burkholderia pseudomallei]OMZ33312.1 hypothetical protein AQ861_16390 [Burkholderia pseudomallei]
MPRLHPCIVVEPFDALNQFRPRLRYSRRRAGFGCKAAFERVDFMAISLKLSLKLADAAQYGRRRSVGL